VDELAEGDKIYPHLSPSISKMGETTGHDGVFFIAQDDPLG
jgi:hypothetical protein